MLSASANANAIEKITVVYDGSYSIIDLGPFFYEDNYNSHYERNYFGDEFRGGGNSTKNKLTAKEKALKLVVCIEGTGDAFNICIKSWDAKIANRKEDCELWGSLGSVVPLFGQSIEKHINKFMGCGRGARQQGVDQQVGCSNLRTRMKAVCRKKYA